MIPILFATSSASWSEERATYAFLLPFGVINVLTFLTLMLYNCWQDCLIIPLLAFLWTMNTSVLSSSMVLIADSLLNGCLTTANLSKVLYLVTALKIFFGVLFWTSVFGLLKVVLVQIFAFLAVCLPFFTAVAAALAGYIRYNTLNIDSYELKFLQNKTITNYLPCSLLALYPYLINNIRWV